MNNKCLNFEKNMDEYFKEIYRERIINKNGNPLITLLITLFLSISYFCMLTYLEIINQNSEILLLDNFIKRYKSFVDGAIHINNKLENLNVIINLIYEKLLNGSQSLEPKFSIYRLMLILYNRIIINPLTDQTQNKNVIKITSNIYDIYLKKELRKIEDKNTRLSNSLSSTNDNSVSNYDDLITNLNSLIDYNNGEDSDFLISQFLENIPSILIDSICDEYSVFYINSTKFPIYGNYKNLQDSFANVIINNLSKFPNLIWDYKYIDFIKENEFINEKFINLSKLNICYCLYKEIMKQCLKELEKDFKEEEFNIDFLNAFRDDSKCKIIIFFKYRPFDKRN